MGRWVGDRGRGRWIGPARHPLDPPPHNHRPHSHWAVLAAPPGDAELEVALRTIQRADYQIDNAQVKRLLVRVALLLLPLHSPHQLLGDGMG